MINDEAHHCYRRRVDGEEEKYTGDARKEADKNKEEARVWISGLEAIQQKLGVRVVYDLSATPFFLKGSGYREGTLFPWVVSDFSLIDAIESGVVKIPRVPVSDDNMIGELPTYRNIWASIRDHLPKKGRKNQDNGSIPCDLNLPKELEGALHSLYQNYEKTFQQWEQNTESLVRGLTPPVMIVVCNNTSISKMVYDWIVGRDTGKIYPDGRPVLAKGNLKLLSNVDDHGNWIARSNTILVDSEQLESGEAMSSDFKKIAAYEIEEFKTEYRQRYPGCDPNKISDEDLLREVLNTVGKSGKLGEQIRCVVSVSMLSEGWDASTVTHILGVRAFGTQLLCEQVVGRGLRRISYATDEKGHFEAEYAEVYGVPFAFIPCAGSNKTPKTGAISTRVRALEERIASEITFPRLIGYRYDVTQPRLTPNFETPGCRYSLSTSGLPTKTLSSPIVGESSTHYLVVSQQREQEIAFILAKKVLEKYFQCDESQKDAKELDVKAWLFPQVLQITKQWIKNCVTYKSGTSPQMLLLSEYTHDAADCIYQAIASGEGQKTLKPILRPYDDFGSTRYVDFDTSRPIYKTDPNKCHITHVVADTNSWEQKMAQVLEDMDEVVCYVKNQGLGFTIPYTMNGEQRNYLPDFIVRMNNQLNLIVEVSGEARKDKAVKVNTTRNLWLPAINQSGAFGRWDIIEITDPWDAENTIRAFLK